jgi:hypothetical protein
MNPRHVKAGAVALAAVMLVGSIMAGSAVADTFDSDISINFRNGTFFGRVKSDKDFCERGRKVRVFRKRKHRPDALIGTDTTNADGKWSVDKSGAKGRYYARVLQKFDRNRDYPDRSKRCREDISRVIRV